MLNLSSCDGSRTCDLFHCSQVLFCLSADCKGTAFLNTGPAMLGDRFGNNMTCIDDIQMQCLSETLQRNC